MHVLICHLLLRSVLHSHLLHLVGRERCLHHARMTRHLRSLATIHHHARVVLLHLYSCPLLHDRLLLLLGGHATSLGHLLERMTHLGMSSIHSRVLTRLHMTHTMSIHSIWCHTH